MNRYLVALGKMREHQSPDIARFARQTMRDMGMPGVRVADIIEPIATRPPAELLAEELALRKLVEREWP